MEERFQKLEEKIDTLCEELEMMRDQIDTLEKQLRSCKDLAHAELIRLICSSDPDLDRISEMCPLSIVNRIGEYGNTPLHLATKRDVMTLLIRHGADVELRDGYEDTPAMCYLKDGRDGDCRYLIEEHGADVNSLDADGRTMYDYAVSRSKNLYDYNYVVKLIKGLGGKPASELSK